MSNVKDFSVEEKLTSLVTLQKIESKLDEIHILKGELPMEVADLEDEIQGLHSRQMRIEEEINGVTDFITQRKEAIKESEALVKKYEKQSSNVKTTTTRISFNRYHGETIAITSTDFFITRQKPVINMMTCLSCEFYKMLFFFLICCDDLFKLAFLG